MRIHEHISTQLNSSSLKQGSRMPKRDNSAANTGDPQCHTLEQQLQLMQKMHFYTNKNNNKKMNNENLMTARFARENSKSN